MVDDKRISFIPAVNISYLDTIQQMLLLNAIDVTNRYPSNKQTIIIKKYYDEGQLNQNVIISILEDQKEKDFKVAISYENYTKYFNGNYTKKQIEEIIIQLLDRWKRDNL